MQTQLKDKDKIRLLQQRFDTFPSLLEYIYKNNYKYTVHKAHLEYAKLLEDCRRREIFLAFRGFSKTTIALIYVVWRIVHNPNIIVLYITRDKEFSSELLKTVLRFIRNIPILNVLAPSRVDTATKISFFINENIRTRVDKSPTVSCIGVRQAGEGKRADLVIGDDIETDKNSKTKNERSIILNAVFELNNICNRGNIILLGTPRYENSVYFKLNNEHGYPLTMFPARFPDNTEMRNEAYLAPYLKEILAKNKKLATGGGIDGSRGQPIEPDFVNEEYLQEKEIVDASDYILANHLYFVKNVNSLVKTSNILVSGVDYLGCHPFINMGLETVTLNGYTFRESTTPNQNIVEYDVKYMWIDPAGAGKDETAVITIGVSGSYIYILGIWGSVAEPDTKMLKQIAKFGETYKVDSIWVENNMNSIFSQMLRGHTNIPVYGKRVSGEKAERIFKPLNTIIANGKLVMTTAAVLQDVSSADKHIPPLCRQINSFDNDPSYVKNAYVDRIDGLSSAILLAEDVLVNPTVEVETESDYARMAKMSKDLLGVEYAKETMDIDDDDASWINNRYPQQDYSHYN